jgi:hypothetical protein
VRTQLHTENQTPSPQRHPPSNAWAPETPHNITDLQQQTALLRHYLKQRTYSPPSQRSEPLHSWLRGAKWRCQTLCCLQVKMRNYAWKTSARKGKGTTAHIYS